MAMKTNERSEDLQHFGRIITYVLHKRTEKGPQQITYGTIAIDSTYHAGSPRPAGELLEYVNKSAFEEAAKDPGFVENFGENPADFFVTIQHEFRT